MHNLSDTFKKASPAELVFIYHNMPRGMVPMIQFRTGASRTEVLYQLKQHAKVQKPEIIQAAREILFAVTGLRFEELNNT